MLTREINKIKKEIIAEILNEDGEAPEFKRILDLSQFPFNYEKFRSYLTIKKRGDGFSAKFEANSSQFIFDNFIYSQYRKINKINFTNAKFRQNGTSTNSCGWGLYAGLTNRYDVAFLGKDEGNINSLQKMVNGFCEDLKLAFKLDYHSKEHEIYFPQYKFTIYFRISNNRSAGIRGLTLGCLINDELGHRNFSSGDTEALFTGKNSVKIGIGTPCGISNLLYVAYKNKKNNNFLFTNWVEMKENETTERIDIADDTLDYLAKVGLNEIPIEKKYWFAERWEAVRGETFNLETRFNQEYPPNIDIGFEATADNCFCEPEFINKAFVNKDYTIKHNEIIIGIDIAGGGDISAVAIKKGDYCDFEILKHNSSKGGLQATEKVEALKNMLLEMFDKSPRDTSILINYDKTGAVGINFDDVIIPMINFLRQSGHEVICKGVHFNQTIVSREFDGEKRINARNTIYMNLRKWFLTEKVLVVDKFNKLQEELLATKIETINGEIRIVKKENIKKGLGRSPDFADALALCFFPPEAKYAIGIDRSRSAYLPIDEDEYN